MKARAHTILFTEACPLECRYCSLKDDSNYGKSPYMDKEGLFETIDKYDKEDDRNEYRTMLVFTGGEPFLYYEWIKEIVEKYQDRFAYQFNTSGYCLTQEMLKFLSRYEVSFVLSVDGGEALTNYLRPVKATRSHTGYFKKVKEIIPTLLYYFPNTEFKMIINARYVDLVYDTYLEADALGFKWFKPILDFQSRPDRFIKGKPWTEKETAILQDEFDKIAMEIVMGMHAGIRKPQITEVSRIITFLLNRKDFSPDLFPCQVFNGRTINSIHGHVDQYCMYKEYPDMNDAYQAIIDEYNKLDGKCKNDPDCLAFDYCAIHGCPHTSLLFGGEFFKFEPLECIINKVSFYTALKILDTANTFCPDAKLYKRMIEGRLET